MRTVQEVVDWVLKNRKGNAFKDYSPIKVLLQVHEGMQRDEILCISEGKDIVGVICWEKMPSNVIFVHDILTTKKGAFKRMIDFLNIHFKGWSVKGVRDGEVINYLDRFNH